MKTPQEIRNNILDLLKGKNSTVNKMLVECGYNTSLVNDLKKGQMPSADKIANIAKYLGVSTDCLLGNEHENIINSDEDFINTVRNKSKNLSEFDKKHIIELMEMLSGIKNK